VYHIFEEEPYGSFFALEFHFLCFFAKLSSAAR